MQGLQVARPDRPAMLHNHVLLRQQSKSKQQHERRHKLHRCISKVGQAHTLSSHTLHTYSRCAQSHAALYC